jgi:hypothetical protein
MGLKSWIAVASAEHVRIGRSGGFMQVCHGKGGPLRRISPGDDVAYYSPTETFGGGDRLQAFTAVGIVQPGIPYQADMGGGFRPFRRDVLWNDTVEVPIRPLLGLLSFTRDNRNWGYQLRLGLFEIEAEDMRLIREATTAGHIDRLSNPTNPAHRRPPTSSMCSSKSAGSS